MITINFKEKEKTKNIIKIVSKIVSIDLDIKKAIKYFPDSYFNNIEEFVDEDNKIEMSETVDSIFFMELVKKINDDKIITIEKIYDDSMFIKYGFYDSRIEESINFLLLDNYYLYKKQCREDKKYELDFYVQYNNMFQHDHFLYLIEKGFTIGEDNSGYKYYLEFKKGETNFFGFGVLYSIFLKDYSNRIFYDKNFYIEEFIQDKYKDPRLILLSNLNIDDTYFEDNYFNNNIYCYNTVRNDDNYFKINGYGKQKKEICKLEYANKKDMHFMFIKRIK